MSAPDQHAAGCLAEYPLGCRGVACDCHCHTPRSYTPKHRRCTKSRHHTWGDTRGLVGGAGWGLVTCTSCGFTDLT